MKLHLIRKMNVGASARYPFRVFLSLMPTQNGFVGVIREHDPTDSGRKTDVRRVAFDLDGKICRDDLIMKGEDPRIFMWKGRPCFLTWLADSKGDWSHWLVDLNTRFKIRLKIEPWMFHGKNWVPVICRGRLIILRSLEPLVVLKVNEKDGACTCIYGTHHHLQPIGEYRGGGCARYKNGVISGFGHRTHNADYHTVFYYTIDVNTWTIQWQDVQVVGVDGMNIIDATSHWDGHVVCCATKGNWHNWQPAIHGVFRIR